MMAAGPAAGRSATQNQNELVGKYNKSTWLFYKSGLTVGMVATPTFGSSSVSDGRDKGIFFTRASTRAMLDFSRVYLFFMSRLRDESKASRMALPTLLVVSRVIVPSPPEDNIFVMCADENWERSTS